MNLLDAAVVAAIIAAFGSFAVFVADRSLASLTRKREKAAEALSEALLWMETPYRIARRPDDEANTLATLSAYLHHLQERHVFNRAWLQVEIPEAYRAYCELLDDIKSQCRPHITDAWNRPPVTTPTKMNLGPLYAVDPDAKVNAYVKSVRAALRPWWKVWP